MASFAGKTFHHETLVYTDSRGQQFYATAYAPRRPDGEDSDTMSGSTKIGSDLAGAAGAAATNGTSPFGSIVTQWGRLSDLPPKERVRLLGPQNSPYDSRTVQVGNDLSDHWSKVMQAYFQVGEQGLPYSPLTQNSNSTASTGLTAGSVPLPTGTARDAEHWSPASDNILWTSATRPKPAPAFAPDAVYSPMGDFYGNFPPTPDATIAKPAAQNTFRSSLTSAFPDPNAPVSLFTRLLSAGPDARLAADETASPPLQPDATPDATDNRPMRFLVGRTYDPSQGSPFKAQPAPAPPSPDGSLSLNDAYLEYLRRLNTN